MLLKGVVIGLSIAIPPGPNAAMCISRTLTAGRGVGLRCGLGAVSAHAIYTVLAVVGVGRASSLLSGSTFALHLAGGVILVALGLRLVRTAPLTDRASTKGATS